MEALAKRNVFVITGLEEELDNSFLSGLLHNYKSRLEGQVELHRKIPERTWGLVVNWDGA